MPGVVHPPLRFFVRLGLPYRCSSLTGIQPSPGKTQRRKVEDRRARAGFGCPVANKDAPKIAEARGFVGRRQTRWNQPQQQVVRQDLDVLVDVGLDTYTASGWRSRATAFVGQGLLVMRRPLFSTLLLHPLIELACAGRPFCVGGGAPTASSLLHLAAK